MTTTASSEALTESGVQASSAVSPELMAMSPRLRQAIAVTIGVILLASVVIDSAGAVFANAHIGFVGASDAGSPGSFLVQRVTDPKALVDGPSHMGFHVGVRVGDRVRLVDRSAANQFRFLRARLGDQFTFIGKAADGTPNRFTATMTPAGPAPPSFWIYQLLRLALVLVGLVVAMRRPNDPVARLMVCLFFGLAALFQSGAPFYPVWLTGLIFVIARFAQVYVAWAALALGTTFPKRSESGLRRWLERANFPYSLLCLATLFSALFIVIVLLVPSPPFLQGLGIAETVLYFVAAATAFVIGGRGATGPDRKRVQWVAWTLCVGFSGTLVALTMILLHVPRGPAADWLGVTFLAIPFGLGYAIVRHRVVDIGFVVNRALVFATVSGIVLLAFAVLEWLLGNVLVSVSHITSVSLELGLALVLGFSLRSIHGKVDALVDDLFFRERHRAEHALRVFAREVAYINDPHVAIARTHRELCTHSGASSVAVYVVAGTGVVRVDPDAPTAPARVDVDDPALVRLRATRATVALRTSLESAFIGNRAFPMIVRDAITGTVVLGAKVNGEAYAPDEAATIETVVIALGNALDALQTAALRAEVARVLNGAPVESLRRTVDPATWADGVMPQPAGSLLGQGE